MSRMLYAAPAFVRGSRGRSGQEKTVVRTKMCSLDDSFQLRKDRKYMTVGKWTDGSARGLGKSREEW